MENTEIELLKDGEYYLFYEMMIQALKTDNVKEGIDKTLFLLKTYLDCGDVVLHKKNESGAYGLPISHLGMKHLVEPIACIVNKTSKLVEHRGIFDLELNLSEDFQNLKLVYFDTESREYILSFNNLNSKKDMDSKFFEKVQETMGIILKRAEMYEKNTMAINTDLLTNLDNRNAYEKRTQAIHEADNELVYGLFDLFRLKYVNDNYSHAVGDTYIKETADILTKYWPKEIKRQTEGTETLEETGHCIYRIGGDEFVLMTTTERLELAKIKASLAAEEVSMIDLGIKENIPIGLNFGVLNYVPGTTIKDTYMAADKIMMEDKNEMYSRYNLERRR